MNCIALEIMKTPLLIPKEEIKEEPYDYNLDIAEEVVDIKDVVVKEEYIYTPNNEQLQISEAKIKKEQKFISIKNEINLSNVNIKNEQIKKISTEKIFQCPICGKGFGSSALTKQHIGYHMKGHVNCWFCGLTFTDCEKFINHYTVPADSDNTRLNSVLLQCSTKYVEHKCDFCLKGFVMEDDLKRHLRFHPEMNEIRFQCNKCSKDFRRKTDLTKHQRKHIEGDFKCHICFKYFSFNRYLQAHLRRHDNVNEKKSICDICTAAFPNNSELKMHLDGHRHIKKFKCKLCSKKYLVKLSLTRHMRKRHGIKKR